jgi:hypothetical protein
MTDETILYKSTFAGIEQNVASCLEEVRTAEGARLQDLQFDRDKFWDSLTTAARKVSVTSSEYFTTAARKVGVTSRENARNLALVFLLLLGDCSRQTLFPFRRRRC